MARIIDAIVSNWVDRKVESRWLDAQVQALGIAYLAECRPNPAGGLEEDDLALAILDEFVSSAYPVPSLQLATPIGFSFRFTPARLAANLLPRLKQIGMTSCGSALVDDLIEAIAVRNTGRCSVQAGESYEEFLRRKAISAMLGSERSREADFPGWVTDFVAPSRPPIRARDVLVMGGCDLSRIANVAQYSLSQLGVESTWWEDLLRVPAGFLAVRLSEAGWDRYDGVLRELSSHMGPIFLNNMRPVLEDRLWPTSLRACVLSLDSDIHKRLHRHRTSGLVVHFPSHWGGPLRNLVKDVPKLNRWIDTEWERMPLQPIPAVIESLEQLVDAYHSKYRNLRIYLVNANQNRPQHHDYDPPLHGDPVEERCRMFNRALRELSRSRGVTLLDFSLEARRGGLDSSKDIRHVRNGVYEALGRALAVDLEGQFQQRDDD